MTNRYLKNIKEVLGENFMTEWIYAGGDTGTHANYFMIFNKEKQLEEPAYTEECACGHEIHENCYIYNPKLNKLEVLGNCCIKKYLKKSGRTCSRCGEPHRNTKDNFCKECRPFICIDCGKEKRPCYRRCYLCNVEYNKRFEDEDSE